MVTEPHVKINLGLSVLHRRDDGFHDIETLFVPCRDSHDTLEIIPSDAWSETSASILSRYETIPVSSAIRQSVSQDGRVMITIARAEGVDWDPLTDLTVKAYYALATDFELPSVKIFLEKTSPVGAGLGGGSADAACALKMLSQMFSLGLQDARLAEYAAMLGSDCPFFIYDRPMFGEGRGEILSDYDLSCMDDYYVKLFIPENIAVSTREAYSGIVPRDRMDRTLRPLQDILQLPVEQWKETLVNDFERTVFAAYPQLAEMKESIYESGAVYASMSGSGSALFGIYKK